MVKRRLFEPRVDAVAACAVGTQLCAMGILVARCAASIGEEEAAADLTLERPLGGVACLALPDEAVEPFQRITGFPVISQCRDPRNQISRDTLVFRVATLTVFCLAPVKAGPAPNSTGYLVMAIQAEFLAGTLARSMALRAVGEARQFSVGPAQFAGRHESLESLGAYCAEGRDQHKEQSQPID